MLTAAAFYGSHEGVSSLPALPSPDRAEIPPEVLAQYPDADGFEDGRPYKLDTRGRRHWLGERGEYKQKLKSVVASAAAKDLALVILSIPGQPKMKDLVRETGMTAHQIGQLLASDDMKETIEQLHGEHYEMLKDRAKAMGLAPLYRQRLLREKGQELLAVTLEKLTDRVSAGDARATMMKVAVEAAFGTIDRDPETAIKVRGGAPINVNKAIILNPGQAKAIAEANEEAGLDMADVLDGRVVDVEPVEPVEDADAEA